MVWYVMVHSVSQIDTLCSFGFGKLYVGVVRSSRSGMSGGGSQVVTYIAIHLSLAHIAGESLNLFFGLPF